MILLYYAMINMYLQTFVNVVIVMEVVNRGVLILMVPITVHAIVGINSCLIGARVQVSTHLLLIIS